MNEDHGEISLLDGMGKQNNFQLKQNDFNRIKETINEIIELTEKRKSENDNIIDEIEDKKIKSSDRLKQKEHIYEKRDKIDLEKENFEVKYHEIRDKILHLENQIKKYRKQHDSSLERTRQLELNIQENKIGIADKGKENQHRK